MDANRINAGYEIIDSTTVGGVEIVLGQSTVTGKYVTWKYFRDGYHWGHYFERYTDALVDFHGRAYDEACSLQCAVSGRKFIVGCSHS